MGKENSEIIPSKNSIIDFDNQIQPTDKKLSKFYSERKQIDFHSFIANLINVGDIAQKAKNIIKPDLKYVVKFTPELLAKMKTNDIQFLNDTTTGDILPVLYDYTEKGFGGQVRLELKGNISSQDISVLSNSLNNLLEQKKYDALIQQIQQINATVKRIERGQDIDRFALIKSGIDKLLDALAIENDNDLRNKIIVEAISTIYDGRKKVELILLDKLNAVTPVTENRFLRLIRCFNPEYYNKHTCEYEDIQEYFEYYCMSIEPLAYAYTELKQPQMIEKIIEKCGSVFTHPNLQYLKSVEPLLNSEIYNKTELKTAWYNNPEQHKTNLLNAYQLNNSKDMYIKLNGSDILEVLDNETK